EVLEREAQRRGERGDVVEAIYHALRARDAPGAAAGEVHAPAIYFFIPFSSFSIISFMSWSFFSAAFFMSPFIMPGFFISPAIRSLISLTFFSGAPRRWRG